MEIDVHPLIKPSPYLHQVQRFGSVGKIQKNSKDESTDAHRVLSHGPNIDWSFNIEDCYPQN